MADDTARLLEEYLVAGARLGEARAISRLAALRGPKLMAHAMRLLRNRDDAEDVVQEAWIEILRGLKGLHDERAFPAWAYRIVTRRAARQVGRRVRERALGKALAFHGTAAAPETGPAAADAAAVRAAIKGLPPGQAAAIALFYLEEMSVREVALALDVPPGTVKTRLMHARARLGDALKGAEDEQA